MAISVLNTDAGLSGKTIVNLEDAQTVTGLKTFDRDPNAPFAVSAGSAVVPNLDADKLDGLEASALAEIANTETISGIWTFSAAPVINAGISFPAVQVSNAGANVLDDYEEGSWTPVIGGSGGTSGQTYATQVGRYVKIGKLVICQFTVTLTAKGTITSTVQIQGLPFTSESVSSLTGATFLMFSSLATNWISVSARVTPNGTIADVQGNQAAAANNFTSLVTADIGNTTQFEGVLIYRASA